MGIRTRMQYAKIHKDKREGEGVKGERKEVEEIEEGVKGEVKEERNKVKSIRQKEWEEVEDRS